MGLFGRRKKKSNVPVAEPTTTAQEALIVQDRESSSSLSKRSKRSKRSKGLNLGRISTTQQNRLSEEPLMDHLTDLILDLETAVETSGDRPARALRMLFALSEHARTDNRTTMVRTEDGRLVTALLSFLSRCKSKSSEHYLGLLVLNNISIPSENKRIIALDHGGAKVFAKLLCEDPSCHLMAIILVNLTFADANLRKELVSEKSGIFLVECLAFALRVASLTAEEFEARQQFIDETSQHLKLPGRRLAILMAEDQRLRQATATTSYRRGKTIADPSRQLFPETARWCLCALKNLTRPCRDPTAAHILIKSSTFSLILQYITISGTYLHSAPKSDPAGNSGSQSSSSESATPVDPVEEFANAPSSWGSQSMQDAALFVVLNLSACSASRDYVYEADAVSILSAITDFPTVKTDGKHGLAYNLKCQQEFQCLKAIMALSYLVGSQGYFGQLKIRSSASTVLANPNDSILVMNETDVELLVELLAHTMHQRGKDGPGGYSAATFNIKYVLFSIRCLLTHTSNQTRIVDMAGRQLNTLLIKALAQYSFRGENMMDAEAAEYACFCLYLQSNHGFKQPFLPDMFTSEKEEGILVAKVMVSYLDVPAITPAGRHAATQLLLRLKFLIFEGKPENLAGQDGTMLSVPDLSFGEDLISEAKMIQVGKLTDGVKPSGEIFDRPILRSSKPKKAKCRGPWDKRAAVSVFPSALQAVQQLSYGSAKVQHSDAIDDILIANSIANSANGETTESYNFWWSWEAKANIIQRNLKCERSETSVGSLLDSLSDRLSRRSGEASEPLAIFGLRCGPMCAADTTS